MPPTDDTPIARRIESAEQLANMTDELLQSLKAEHEAEIIALAGRIAVGEQHPSRRDPEWIHRARRALQSLRLHSTWIGREIAKRHTEAARRARLARIEASNSADARQTAVFKKVAHEVLGDEMYAHLWQLTLQRLQPPAA